VRPLSAAAVATTVTLLTACTGGGSHTSAPSASSSASPSASGAPSAIRPIKAVAPEIEAFVEKERGLHFKHKVQFKLLGGKAFLARLHLHDKPPNALDVEKSQAVFATLGLMSPHADLVKAFRTATDAGTLGFYDFKSKKMYVKGHRATPGARAVLAHELTHALTDQWFGLDRPKLDKSNQELSLAFTALIEGDAERTRVAYEKTLSPADQALAKKQEGGDDAPPKVPQVVLELIGFPYAIGPSFVNAVVDRGGIKALNQAYRHPPRSSEQLLAPQEYFLHDNPAHVAVPHADAAELDHGDLGVIGLALMLEHGIGSSSLQGVLTGWAGDQYVVWRTGAHAWCLRDTVVMDDETAAVRLDNALSQWVASRSGRAQLEHQGTSTTFKACAG
jgi:hypothetical protein